MENKYVALLLVVCLIAATTVEAQESQISCFHDCVSIDCGEQPSTFCKFLCGFGCSGTGLTNSKLIHLHICMIFVLWNIRMKFLIKPHLF